MLGSPSVELVCSGIQFLPALYRCAAASGLATASVVPSRFRLGAASLDSAHQSVASAFPGMQLQQRSGVASATRSRHVTPAIRALAPARHIPCRSLAASIASGPLALGSPRWSGLGHVAFAASPLQHRYVHAYPRRHRPAFILSTLQSCVSRIFAAVYAMLAPSLVKVVPAEWPCLVA